MKRYHLIALLLVCMICFNACGKEDVEVPKPLATVGGEPISIVEFEQALELAKVQYSYKDLQDPETLQFVKEHVLLQLIEDSWIQQRADELGIEVSNEMLNEQVQRIEEDYPAGAFETVLLEKAIAFEDWQDSIRRRLLSEAVIRHDLAASGDVKKADIAQFKKQYPAYANIPDIELAEEIRLHKREKAFAKWREKMKKNFPVVIDPEQWAKISNP